MFIASPDHSVSLSPARSAAFFLNQQSMAVRPKLATRENAMACFAKSWRRD
jgi:hypothetical protein